MLTVLFSLSPATLLISADQLIKWWARTFLAPAEPIWLIEGIFQLTYVENRGAAWGLFQGQRWPLLIVTGIVLILLLCYLVVGKATHPMELTALTLLFSGGVGNLIDRLFLGFVTDYFYYAPINFPVFNLADVCVVVGTGLLCLYWVIQAVRQQREKAAETEEKTDEPED